MSEGSVIVPTGSSKPRGRRPLRGFARLHKVVTYLVAYLGLCGLAVGGELEPLTLVALAVGYAATWSAEAPTIHDPRWQSGWTAALLVALVVEVGRALAGTPYLAAALEWSALLQIARLASRRSAREHLQVAVLAFVHLCAATVLSTDVAYAAVFAGFLLVSPWMLTLTQLRAELEGMHRARNDEAMSHAHNDERDALAPDEPFDAAEAALQRLLSSRRLVGASFFVGTTLLSIPVFAVTAVVFLVFPRVGLGMLAFGRDRGTAVAGLGNEVELGQIGRIRDDPTVIARVTARSVASVAPRYLDLRLRATSFDHYDGRRWSRTLRRAGRTIDPFLDEYVIVREHRADDIAYTISLEHLDQAIVLLPERTVSISIPPRVVSGLESPRTLLLHPGLDLRHDADGTEIGLRYVAWSSAAPLEETSQPMDEQERAHYLQVPEGHHRVVDLARRWTADVQGERARVERLVERLRSAPFEYSLDMRNPASRPPLEAFLFDWHAGHCEYFASALAVMLRGLGIPSRNVTGFRGARWNAFGRYYAVRSGDAHAWVEAYLPGEGWVAFDPTPSGPPAGLVDSVWTDLGNLWDAAVVFWELDVVSYDLRAQRDLARGLWRWFRRSNASAHDEGRQPSSGLRVEGRRSSGSFESAIGALVVLVVGASLAIALALRRRKWSRVGSRDPSVRRLVAIYRRLEAVLEKHGFPRPVGRTPLEHASWLEAREFRGAKAVREVTRRYNDARFGADTLKDADFERLEALVDALDSVQDRF